MSTEVYLPQVKDCEARDSCLSDIERGFVASLRWRLERGRSLTAQQAARLDEIWERVVSAQPAARSR